jgi:hypothetical protein
MYFVHSGTQCHVEVALVSTCALYTHWLHIIDSVIVIGMAYYFLFFSLTFADFNVCSLVQFKLSLFCIYVLVQVRDQF